jgi:DNA end-binding protein Ku
MARPIWRGHLRLALVSCPVALYNARHDRAGIRFHLINPDTGNRIRMITQDAETGKELERRDLVKGYEFRKNQYVLLNDEDFDSVKVESSSVMNIEKFIDTDSIDPVYYDAAYYAAPDGDAGRDVYAVLREAIARTGKTALARVVIAQRERTIAMRPTGNGLIAHTLYEERDLNSAKDLFDGLGSIKTDPEMVQLASQLVQRQSGQYDAADLEDRYETRLRAMIEAKLKGEGIDSSEPNAGAHKRRRSDGSAEEEPWSGGRRQESGAGEEKGCRQGYADQATSSGGQAQAGIGPLPFFLPALQSD